jgi:hypothetical protein
MRRDVNVLARDIVLDKFDTQVIVGISRGGHSKRWTQEIIFRHGNINKRLLDCYEYSNGCT